MGHLPRARVAEVFVDFADTLVVEFDVIEFLQMVASRTAELLVPAQVGLLVAAPGSGLGFTAASEERAQMLELFQEQARTGPCLDCFTSGLAVVNADLGDPATPWPALARRAIPAGFRMVHAFPMRLRDEVIGVLAVLGTDATTLAPDDVRTVQALADVATIGLLQERAIRLGGLLTEQLQGALDSRVIIEQAKGAIAQARGCSVDDAFALMRTYCRENSLRLSAVAQAVVSDGHEVIGLSTG